MKTLFSILSIVINAALDEKISIGLVMTANEQTFFKYSSKKLNAIKGLLPPHTFAHLRSYLKSLESEIRQPMELNRNMVSERVLTSPNWTNENYLAYLSKYSNNLLQFSAPKYMDISFSDSTFQRVFEKYIYAYETTTLSKIENTDLSVFEKLQTMLYPNIRDKVNIDKQITSTDVKDLFVPVTVNFIGQNKVPVVGQAFDFGKQLHNLENDFSRFISLSRALEVNNSVRGKYFVIGAEPSQKAAKNHNLWEQMNDSRLYDFVPLDELARIDSYITEHEVCPYF